MKKYILLFGILAIIGLGMIVTYTLFPSAPIEGNGNNNVTITPIEELQASTSSKPIEKKENSDVNEADEEVPPILIYSIKVPITKANISVYTKIPKVPDKMMVYKVNNNNITREYVIELAKRFEMKVNNLTEDTKYGFYIIDRPFELEVEKSGAIHYADWTRIYGKEYNPQFPSDDEAINATKKFLTEKNLIDGAKFSGVIRDEGEIAIWNPQTKEVTYKNETTEMQVFFNYEIDGVPVVGGCRLQVYIGDKNKNNGIIGFFKVYRNYTSWESFKIRTPNEALDVLKKIGIHSTAWPNPVKEAKVKNMYLAYYTQPAVDVQEYIQPIYVFEIEADTGDKIEKIEEYIPAIPQPNEYSNATYSEY